MVRSIDVKTLKDAMDAGKAVLIDVREPFEFASQSIENALNLPLNTISCNQLPAQQGKQLVLHCQAGKRSLAACEKLLQVQPDIEINNLDGGIVAWEKAGYPTEDAKKKSTTTRSTSPINDWVASIHKRISDLFR